jgi:NUC194 domain
MKFFGKFCLPKKFKIHSFILFSSKYAAAGYKCLATVLRKTQTKEVVFSQFLFTPLRDKGEELWENLIDCKKELTLEVKTNFEVKVLGKDEAPKKEDEKVGRGNLAQSLAKKYFEQSFYTQTEEKV